MKDPRQVILRPIVSERSYDDIELGRYTFEVAKEASKPEIAQAVQDIFSVNVVSVNTLNVKPKPKRVRHALGKTRAWKKAIVKLQDGDTIDFFAS
jgi:large subunit ribosomal protein L23